MTDTKQVQIHAFPSIPAVRKYRALARANERTPRFRGRAFRIKSRRSFFLWEYSNLCANFLRTTTLTFSRLADSALTARLRAAALRLPLPIHFCFGGGDALKNGMERQSDGLWFCFATSISNFWLILYCGKFATIQNGEYKANEYQKACGHNSQNVRSV